MTTTSTTDLRHDLPVAVSAAATLEAVARVEAWWSTACDRSGDEFTVHFDRNWTRIRVDGPGRWTVTAMDTPALPVADEWVGDRITFEVEPTGDDASVLHFTHHGLLAQACIDDCRPAWRSYLTSLVALAETGTGHPWQQGMAPGGGSR